MRKVCCLLRDGYGKGLMVLVGQKLFWGSFVWFASVRFMVLERELQV